MGRAQLVSDDWPPAPMSGVGARLAGFRQPCPEFVQSSEFDWPAPAIAV